MSSTERWTELYAGTETLQQPSTNASWRPIRKINSSSRVNFAVNPKHLVVLSRPKGRSQIKRARLRHLAKQRRKAMEMLVQAKSDQDGYQTISLYTDRL